MKAETETQKVISKGHLQYIKWKSLQVKKGLQQMNKGTIENIRLRENKNLASLYNDTKKKNATKFQVGWTLWHKNYSWHPGKPNANK